MLEQGFQQVSSCGQLPLPAALCLLPSERDLRHGGADFVTYTRNCQHGRQESIRHKDQLSRLWAVCVQPSVARAIVQWHGSTQACTPSCGAGVPGGGWGSLPSAGWAALLWTATDSVRCRTYELGMQNPTGLFIPPANSHWQLHISYCTNRSCGNGSWYGFLLFSHASLLLHGVSSILKTLHVLFPQERGMFLSRLWVMLCYSFILKLNRKDLVCSLWSV